MDMSPSGYSASSPVLLEKADPLIMAEKLENLIADFLPDSDKDVPREIALAVSKEVIELYSILPSSSEVFGSDIDHKISSMLGQMSIEEYAHIRSRLLAKMAGTL